MSGCRICVTWMDFHHLIDHLMCLDGCVEFVWWLYYIVLIKNIYTKLIGRTKPANDRKNSIVLGQIVHTLFSCNFTHWIEEAGCGTNNTFLSWLWVLHSSSYPSNLKLKIVTVDIPFNYQDLIYMYSLLFIHLGFELSLDVWLVLVSLGLTLYSPISYCCLRHCTIQWRRKHNGQGGHGRCTFSSSKI